MYFGKLQVFRMAYKLIDIRFCIPCLLASRQQYYTAAK